MPVLLALGMFIVMINLDLIPVSGNGPAGFYWLELGGVNKSVYRSSDYRQLVSAIRAQGKENSASLEQTTLEKTTLETMTEIIGRQKVVGAVLIPGKSFTLTPVSCRLSFFLNQPLFVNKANNEELALIPGIGPVMAGKIINYRRQNGSFNDRNSLLAVPGIGPKTAAKIAPFVSFE